MAEIADAGRTAQAASEVLTRGFAAKTNLSSGACAKSETRAAAPIVASITRTRRPASRRGVSSARGEEEGSSLTIRRRSEPPSAATARIEVAFGSVRISSSTSRART